MECGMHRHLMLNPNLQYWIVIFIRMSHFPLKGMILVILSYDMVPCHNLPCTRKLTSHFQSAILLISIISIIIHVSLFMCYRCNFNLVPIENIPFLSVILITGFVSLIFGIVKSNSDTTCGRHSTMNICLGFIFISLMLIFIPVFIQFRPDPDHRKMYISSIFTGYMVFHCCVYMSARYLSVHFSCIWSLRRNTLPGYHLFSCVFLLASSIFIYFPLSKDVKGIFKRHYDYENWINEESRNPNESDIGDYLFAVRCDFHVFLVYVTDNLFSILIGVLCVTVTIFYAVRCPNTEVCQKKYGNQTLVIYESFSSTIIYTNVMGTVLSVWYLYDIIRRQCVKTLKSKMDSFILDFSSLGQIIYAIILIHIYIPPSKTDTIYGSFATVSMISNIVLIIQVICQRFVILEILQRNMEKRLPPESNWYQKLKSQVNHVLILCIINFGLAIVNMLVILIPLDVFQLNSELTLIIIRYILLPLAFLNRLHGCTFLLNVLLESTHHTPFG